MTKAPRVHIPDPASEIRVDPVPGVPTGIPIEFALPIAVLARGLAGRAMAVALIVETNSHDERRHLVTIRPKPRS